MTNVLRLRNLAYPPDDGDDDVLPSTDGAVPVLPRRRRKKRQTLTPNYFQGNLFIALPLVFLLCLIAGFKTFTRTSSLSYEDSAQIMETFAPPFPRYGRSEFQKRCPWTLSNGGSQDQRKVYVTTLPESNEGLAQWVSGIGTGYILAELLQAKLYIDFDPNVDTLQIIEPVTNERNWTIPSSFVCDGNCRKVYGIPSEGQSYSFSGQPLPKIPVYRHASKKNNKMNILHDHEFDGLRRMLPGLHVRDGFACAFQRLIQLSLSKSVQYQPDLFTTLLPALSSSSELVLSLYVRTGYTDEIVLAEREGRDWPDPGTGSSRPSKAVIDCALELETLSSKENVVWMVISDSMAAKEWIVSTFSTETRQVLVTQARGKHTRPGSHPGTDDFAEAFLDWYLIGESNAVITNNRWYSYGFMGAARTSRPFYEASPNQASKCSKVSWAE
jgi:hypothetical protein